MNSAIAKWLWCFAGREVFIETGSKNGDTIEDIRSLFEEIHSIEINLATAERCRDRFANEPDVRIHCGDSRDVLPHIIDPNRPTLFYLDAHCEGAPSSVPEADTECPILRELEIIVAQPWILRPAIVVDDIHMFRPDYWTDPNTNHHLFTRKDWPIFDQLADMLGGYTYVEDTANHLGVWA